MKILRTAVVTLGLVITLPAAADAVDDYVQRQMQQHKLAGLSVLIMRNGEISKIKGYGLANIEHQAPVSPATIFQSGSVGKQFTAAAILILADRGKLELDDPLAKHFADVPSAWHRITIRQLLSHTSGLKDYGTDEIDYRRDYTEDELLRIMMQLPAEFEPGTQWSYSNSGYIVLGILVSKLAGEHWSEFVKKQVFAPAGMQTARMISDIAIVPNRAAGYERGDDGELRNQGWVSQTLLSTGDGALYFSARDLAAWDAALHGRKLLSSDSYDAWWTPIRIKGGLTFPYGFGWDIADQRGRRVIEHGGSWQGFRTSIARYVEDGITVAVLANASDAEPENIAHEIAGIVENRLKLPALDKAGANPDTQRTAKLRGVLEAWAAWQESQDMATALANTLTGSAREASSRQRTAERLRQATKFAWLADDDVAGRRLQRRGEDIARIAYYLLETADIKYRYRFYLTADDRVADFVEG